MASFACLKEPHTETACDPRHALCNIVHNHRRLIWVICASISLLSARHLLVEQNIHYPLQLYFNQLIVAGLITLWPYRRWQDTRELFRKRSQSRRPITWGTVLLAVSMCFMSLSIICTLQAILHFQNLPTLVMMTVRLHVSQISLLRH
jgi:peptidoglycan/LPS O-acetylase OafA/YrhL